MDVNQKPVKAPTGSTGDSSSDSAFSRMAQFALRHPIGIAQLFFLSLVATVILQNLEPTSIDVLFWSLAGIPKLVLILFSMGIGVAAWELMRRLLRR